MSGDPVLSNELADMAETAGAAWRAHRASARESAARAIETGYLLVAARNRALYGTWWPFLQRAGIPERQAQRLMQLARAHVQPDTVSAFGGIKATLEALGKFRLPEPGHMVLVDALKEPRTFGFVWLSAESECFNVAGITVGQGTRWMNQPISGPLVFPILHLVIPPNDDIIPAFMPVPLDEDLEQRLGELLGRAKALGGEPIQEPPE